MCSLDALPHLGTPPKWAHNPNTMTGISDLRCYQMRYDFTPLAIETGGRQAEVTEALLCRLIDIAGCGGASEAP